MKVISPGVAALHPIRIEINEITSDMVHWWVLYGAEVAGKEEDVYKRNKGWHREQKVYIRMPGYKWCHHHANGTTQVTIHLREQDAPTASLFCLKFFDHVLGHNIKVPEDETILH
jgi:hypothetical protein